MALSVPQQPKAIAIYLGDSQTSSSGTWRSEKQSVLLAISMHSAAFAAANAVCRQGIIQPSNKASNTAAH